MLEHGGTLADMPAFREELTTLIGRLVRHRQAGGDLVYEAYSVDLGGQGDPAGTARAGSEPSGDTA